MLHIFIFFKTPVFPLGYLFCYCAPSFDSEVLKLLVLGFKLGGVERAVDKLHLGEQPLLDLVVVQQRVAG